MGIPLPLPKVGGTRQIYCDQTAGWIKMVLGTEVGFSPGDFELDEEWIQPPPKKGAEPPLQFSAHFYCGQTAGCIKMPMPLGMEVSLSPVLHEDQKRGGQTAVRIKMPHGTEVGLGPHNIVLHGDPSPPPQKGAEPLNLPIFIVAKRLDASRCHLLGRPRTR